MYAAHFHGSYDGWKTAARVALHRGQSPETVAWIDDTRPQAELFAMSSGTPTVADEAKNFLVPRRFFAKADVASSHRDATRWEVLYRILWRLTHGEPHLLEIPSDPDVDRLEKMILAVDHDVHRMRAFVRFREVKSETGVHYSAWYQPDHYIVERNAEFFRDRFASLHWSIFTPDRCMHWDGSALQFTPGVEAPENSGEDPAEALWQTYYRSTFNPARLKIPLMESHLPRRFWQNLPEANAISGLVAEAPRRVDSMIELSLAKLSPTEITPPQIPAPATFENLRAAVQGCRGCALWKNASCAVFGEGPSTARIMLVGEQPGDQEDRSGKPFVGPAGQLLDRALRTAGLNREQLYVTNAVKHFKWTPRGKIRLHARPSAREIAACRPWLSKEIELLSPALIVCLGATAAHAVCDQEVKVLERRGEFLPNAQSVPALITLHPSALLRLPPDRNPDEEFAAFVADLRKASPFLTR